jgi:hypothetical protein
VFDQVKEDKKGGACSTNGVKGHAHRELVEEPGGKRLLGRPKCREVDNIKIDHRETGWGGVYWTHLDSS